MTLLGGMGIATKGDDTCHKHHNFHMKVEDGEDSQILLRSISYYPLVHSY